MTQVDKLFQESKREHLPISTSSVMSKTMRMLGAPEEKVYIPAK